METSGCHGADEGRQISWANKNINIASRSLRSFINLCNPSSYRMTANDCVGNFSRLQDSNGLSESFIDFFYRSLHPVPKLFACNRKLNHKSPQISVYQNPDG